MPGIDSTTRLRITLQAVDDDTHEVLFEVLGDAQMVAYGARAIAARLETAVRPGAGQPGEAAPAPARKRGRPARVDTTTTTTSTATGDHATAAPPAPPSAPALPNGGKPVPADYVPPSTAPTVNPFAAPPPF